MKQIKVKYHNGTTICTGKGCLTAPMADQVLKQAKTELQKAFGAYDFRLERPWRNKGYQVVAYFLNREGQREFFVESEGKTPREAIKNWRPGAEILRRDFGVSL